LRKVKIRIPKQGAVVYFASKIKGYN